MTETKTILGIDQRLVFALVGIAVLAVAWLFLLSPMLLGGEEPVEPVVPVAAAPQTDPAAVPTEEPTAAPSEALPPIDETFEVFSARDPFEQLVDDEAAATATDDASDTATTDDSGVTVEADPAKNPPASTTGDGTKVVVDDVFTEDGADYVLLNANDKVYTLQEGDEFATNWRVEAIDDPCVTLLYGDQARLVCEGESIRK
jgi:hypothetical protein